jgi:hypothetical protein
MDDTSAITQVSDITNTGSKTQWTQTDNFKPSSSSSSSSGKRLKPTFKWSSVYEATIEPAKSDTNGSTQRVNLSYGYEKNELKKIIFNIRRYTATGRATTDGLFFEPEELAFLRDSVAEALVYDREYKAKHQFSQRMVIVRSKHVRDRSYVPSPDLEDVAGDGHAYKKVVAVGFRKNEFTMSRELELDAASRLVEELDHAQFILLAQANNARDGLFQEIFGMLLLKLIEPTAHQWPSMAEALLNDELELKRVVEDSFDFDGYELRQQIANNMKALTMDMTNLNSRFNFEEALEAVRHCLTHKVWEDEHTHRMYSRIAARGR